MTNKEWLDYLAHNAPDELAAWFDAEHVENQEQALDGDTEPESEDSREKLEADVFKAADDMEMFYNGERFIDTRKIIGWLDRQAAITERKCRKPNWSYCETCEALEKLTAERDTLQGALDIAVQNESKLEAERDELKERADYNSHGWAKANIGWAEANAESEKWRMKCNEYRNKFGKCLDYADAIHALMDDEGMA